ncbi:MAG: 3D domain-containing protein [Verrucomicrobiae bacterium]|nr:3D domain-containing protein [Verrucomicrobiae bacterium]
MQTVTRVGLMAVAALGLTLSHAQASRAPGSALARITFYSGDRDSGGPVASTGVRLEEGKHVAVDPSVIPYGSEVTIPGLGSYRAVDTGSAVVARTAARRSSGGDSAKAAALVIDVFVSKRQKVHQMAAAFPMYAKVSWRTPTKGSSDRRASVAPSARTQATAKSSGSPLSKQTAQARPDRKVTVGVSSKG